MKSSPKPGAPLTFTQSFTGKSDEDGNPEHFSKPWVGGFAFFFVGPLENFAQHIFGVNVEFLLLRTPFFAFPNTQLLPALSPVITLKIVIGILSAGLLFQPEV